MSDLEKFGYKQELKRRLSFWDLLVYGLIFIIPIAPFGVLGYMIADSKGMVVLVYAVGLIGMGFTALSYATMSEEFPIAGSVYSYARLGINKSVGFLAGWAILLDYILVPATIYLVSISALTSILPLPVWLYLVLFIVINTFINIRGIELAAIVNKVILLLQILVVGIFIVLGVLAIINGVNGAEFTMTPLYNAENISFGFILGSVSLAIFSFLGFDGLSTFAEEAKGGRKTVGKAAIASVIIIGLLFMVQSWIAAELMKGITTLNADIAFYQIVELIGGKWLQVLASIATVLSWGFACALAYQAAISRLLYSMARDKKMPSFLAKVHPKYKTPYIGVYITGALALVIGITFRNMIDLLANIVSFGAIVSFIAINFAVIWHFVVRNRSKKYIRHLISPLIGLTIMISVIINMDFLTIMIGGVWLLIGLTVLLLEKKERVGMPSEVGQEQLVPVNHNQP